MKWQKQEVSLCFLAPRECRTKTPPNPGGVFVCAESFEFAVLEILSQPEPGYNTDRLLTALKLHWQEQLQPFGERGHNNLK